MEHYVEHSTTRDSNLDFTDKRLSFNKDENNKIKMVKSSTRPTKEFPNNIISSKLNQISSHRFRKSDLNISHDAGDDKERDDALRLLRLIQYRNENNGTEMDYQLHAHRISSNDRTDTEESNEDQKTIASFQARKVKDAQRKTDFICFACHEPFKHPRTLPCLHTFCSGCISSFKTYPASQNKASYSFISDESESGATNNDYYGNLMTSQSLQRQRSASAISSDSHFSLDYRKSDAGSTLAGKYSSLRRSKSKHAKVIENSIKRSHSYSDQNLEKNGTPRMIANRSSSANVLSGGSFHGQIIYHEIDVINNATRDRSRSSPLSSKYTNDVQSNLQDGEDEDRLIIVCPICHRETSISASLENLPVNFMVERFVSRDISDQSIGAGTNSCNFCTRAERRRSANDVSNKSINNKLDENSFEQDANNLRATIHCVDCDVVICSHCATLHRLGKKTKRHKLVSLSRQRMSQSSDRSTERSLSFSSATTGDYNNVFPTETTGLNESINASLDHSIGEKNTKDDNITRKVNGVEHHSYYNVDLSHISETNPKRTKKKTKAASRQAHSTTNLSETPPPPPPPPNRPGVLKSIRKLKLPNLHRFSKLFGWGSDSTHNKSSSSKYKETQPEDQQDPNNIHHADNKKDDDNKNDNNLFKNGLVNGGFDDRVTRSQYNLKIHDMDILQEGRDSDDVRNKFTREMNTECTVIGSNMQETANAEQSLERRRSKRRRRPYSDSVASLRRERHSTHPMTCPRHPNEDLQLFCVDCNLCVCRECVVERHSTHSCQLMTRHLFQSQMEKMDHLIQEVVPCMQRVDQQMTSLTEVKAAVDGNATQVKKEVDDFMDLYVDAIQKQRDILIAQVTSHVEDKDRILDVTRRHLLHMRSEVDRTCQFVSDLVTGASDREILAMKGLIIDRLQDLKGMDAKSPLSLDGSIRFNSSDKGGIINNFQMFGRIVIAKQPCPSKSFFSVEGLANARMCSPCTCSVTVCDRESVKVHTGCDVRIKAWVVSQENSGRNIPVQISSSKNGVRTVTFTPLDKGYHSLHVTVQGCTVRNSPYKFYVMRGSHRRHVGVFYCCTYCYGEVRGQNSTGCGCGSTGRVGYPGCYHENPDHPGCLHWSCCGITTKESKCALQVKGHGQGHSNPPSVVRQVTL